MISGRFGATSTLRFVTPGYVTSWSVQAIDQPQIERVAGCQEHNLNCARCGFDGEGCWRTSESYDYSGLALHQLGSKRRQPIVLILCPAKFGHDILAIYVARFLQALKKGIQA